MANPRWVLSLTLLAILPVVVLGFLVTQRLIQGNDERYEQEVVSARYAAEIAQQDIETQLRDYFRPRRQNLTYAHLKGEEKFELTLRNLYFTSALLDVPQFVSEDELRDLETAVWPAVKTSEEPDAPVVPRHVCDSVLMAVLRYELLLEGRDRMGFDPKRGKFRKPALIIEEEEIDSRAPLRWMRVDINGPVVHSCPECRPELARVGRPLSEDEFALLAITFPMPGRDQIDPGLFGAVVPAKDLLREVVKPALIRWNEGSEALPRHALRVVDLEGGLVLPRLGSKGHDSEESIAKIFREADALHATSLLGEGSPWKLEVIALSGFDPTRIRVENGRWQLAIAISALLLALGALLFGRAFVHQTENTRLRTHLLSNISHELKTPLSLIRLYTDTLESGRARDAEESSRFLGIIGRESKRLTHLIDNLLDVQRIEEERKHYSFAQVRPDRVVRSTVEAYRYQWTEAGFAIEVAIDEDLPLLHLDEEALAQALINLLDNAAKYSDTQKEIRVRCRRKQDQVCISVQDRGIGIPAREQEKIFQSFYRVEKGLVHDVKGSGLGLAVVAHVARAHGGRVEVESTPGKGSTFTICLPLDFEPEDA